MKRYVLLSLALCVCFFCFSQIRIASAANSTVSQSAAYDSTQNILPESQVYAYIGQELYVMPKEDNLQKYGFRNFSKSPTASFIAKTPYNQLAGKTFKVDEVTENNGKYILSLTDKDGNERWYFKYTDSELDNPFLCLGFKEKYEQVHSSFDYYVRAGIRYWSKVDFVSGEHIDWDAHTIWKFKEYIYDPHHGYAGLFTNSDGQTLAVYDEDDLVPTILFDSLVKKYGQSMCDYAIKSLIKEGMPSELLTIAWGKPRKIDTDSKGQYWFFENNLVRLENDKVVNWSSL